MTANVLTSATSLVIMAIKKGGSRIKTSSFISYLVIAIDLTSGMVPLMVTNSHKTA